MFLTALSAFKQGDLTRCKQLCLKLLEVSSSEVNTLRLISQVELSQGQLEEAEQRLLCVIQLAPDYAHAYLDLGEVQIRKGELDCARHSLMKVLELSPSLKTRNLVLKKMASAGGKLEELHDFAESFQLTRDVEEDINTAIARINDGKTQEAEAICLNILSKDPDNTTTKEMLINIAMDTSRAEWAEKLALSIIEEIPESPKWWLKLASARSRQDKLEYAEHAILRALEIDPDSVDARLLLGGLRSKSNKFSEALEQYNQILDSDPKNCKALSQKANILKTIGNNQESVEIYQQCLKYDPQFGEAAWALSNLKTHRFSDDDVSQFQRTLETGGLGESDLIHFNFALGKAFEQRGEWHDSFRFYQAGNEAKRKLVMWNADNFSHLIDRIITTFDLSFVDKHRKHGATDKAPIFILGLPRSGSTLQEQILASHSEVAGTRELPYIPWLAKGLNSNPHPMASKRYPEGIRELREEHFQQLARRYLDQAAQHRPANLPYFVDKLPNNFIYLGLILLILPNSKVINTQRDPMDNCFSCYRQLWAEGQNFTYDLSDLGRYYRDYLRLMEHWRTIFPGCIYDAQYEHVVENLEKHVTSLLKYCDLPFEEKCLLYHKTKRAVNTASSEQVRQPLYNSAINYSENFEPYLGSLQAALTNRH
jgi:tetratricopeptide (TPR) repeat protein